MMEGFMVVTSFHSDAFPLGGRWPKAG